MVMMKKITVFAAFLLITSGAMAQSGERKVGVVNLEAALFNTEAAQEMQASLEQEFSDDQQRLQELNNQLQSLAERAQREQSILTDSELRRINADAEDTQVQMRQISQRVQEGMQERQQEFVDSMREDLGTAIETVVEEGDYDLVLNASAVAYFNNSYNITAQVTAELNELTAGSSSD